MMFVENVLIDCLRALPESPVTDSRLRSQGKSLSANKKATTARRITDTFCPGKSCKWNRSNPNRCKGL